MNVYQFGTVFALFYPMEALAQCVNDDTTGTTSMYSINPVILDTESGILKSPGYPNGIPERVRCKSHGVRITFFLLKWEFMTPKTV